MRPDYMDDGDKEGTTSVRPIGPYSNPEQRCTGKDQEMDQHQEQQNGTSHLRGTSATRYTFFLPLNHNNGTSMQHERLARAEQAILQQAGGLTRLSPGVGFWVGPTLKVFRDRVVPIQVVVPYDRVSEDWFAYWAIETAGLLEQHRIFIFAQRVWLVDALPPLTLGKAIFVNGSGR